MADSKDIKEVLIEWANRFEQPEFIDTDPIQIPHSYSHKQDVEISALVTSWMSYGMRKVFIKTASELMHRFRPSPYEFIMSGGFDKWRGDTSCLYRMNKYADLYDLCQRLREIYQANETLEQAVDKDHMLDSVLENFRGINGFPKPGSTSCKKKVCMFLRWMVRRNSSVDLGIWKSMDPKNLLIPVDVHVHKVAAELGLTSRKTVDEKMAEELTKYFEEIFPGDPSRGDFSLYGYGISGGGAIIKSTKGA